MGNYLKEFGSIKKILSMCYKKRENKNTPTNYNAPIKNKHETFMC